MTEQQQLTFNQLHIDYIVQDKRFRNWGKLFLYEKTEIIDEAERLAEAHVSNLTSQI